MLLHWGDHYKTGHPQIDEQHKEIIDQMNILHEAVCARKGAAIIRPLIRFLEQYVKEHFSYEEQCAQFYQCPKAKENQLAHKAFVQKVEQIRKLSDDHDFSHQEVMDLYYEMMEWIKGHILEIDVTNFYCVRDKIKQDLG